MPKFGTFKDERDGYVYKTIRIGNQTWFAENFRYDCAGSFAYDKDSNCPELYGRLYTWRTAMNAAPEGWRLPNVRDWSVLTRLARGEDFAPMNLKSKDGWVGEKNRDLIGFGALPGGYISDGLFYGVNYCGCWWVSDNYLNKHAKCRVMNMNRSTNAVWDNCDHPLSYASSVRYIKF